MQKDTRSSVNRQFTLPYIYMPNFQESNNGQMKSDQPPCGALKYAPLQSVQVDLQFFIQLLPYHLCQRLVVVVCFAGYIAVFKQLKEDRKKKRVVISSLREMKRTQAPSQQDFILVYFLKGARHLFPFAWVSCHHTLIAWIFVFLFLSCKRNYIMVRHYKELKKKVARAYFLNRYRPRKSRLYLKPYQGKTNCLLGEQDFNPIKHTIKLTCS